MSKFLLLISLYTKIKIKEEKIDEFVNEEKGGSFMDADCRHSNSTREEEKGRARK